MTVTVVVLRRVGVVGLIFVRSLVLLAMRLQPPHAAACVNTRTRGTACAGGQVHLPGHFRGAHGRRWVRARSCRDRC